MKTQRRPPGIGRGLSIVLAASGEHAPGADELRDIPIGLIDPNPHQPRRNFDPVALQMLADSLEIRGVLQPVLVRPIVGDRYELVAGERRWRAAGIAGLERIPAIVRERDDAQTLEVALIENVLREDLNPVEEARACAALVDELSLTQDDVGRRVGRSRVAVSNLLRLLDLPDEVLALLESGELTESHGRALLAAEDNADRRRLGLAAAEEGWSVRVLEERARNANAPQVDGAEPASAPGAGGAKVDPERAASATDLGDALQAVFERDVRVRPRGVGYKVEMVFDDVQDAVAFAQRFGALERE